MKNSNEIETVSLHKLRLAAAHYVDLPAIRDAKLDVYQDAANRLVMMVRTEIVGMREKTINIERQWPADWWQAFKERWCPQWMLRRWPVRYERVSVHEDVWKAIFPNVTAEGLMGRGSSSERIPIKILLDGNPSAMDAVKGGTANGRDEWTTGAAAG